VDCEPLAGSLPVQAPAAVQAVALLALHFKVELLPEVTVLGVAVMVTVGAALVVVTVAVWVAEPPGPLQVRV
jgi:hypothetical protein